MLVDAGVNPIIVFDGKTFDAKKPENDRRKLIRDRAKDEAI